MELDLRILLFSFFFPPFVGGVENIVAAEAVGLAARGHRVTVFTASLPGQLKTHEWLADNLDLIRVPELNPLARDHSDAIGLARELAHLLREDFDIVHSHLLTYPWTAEKSFQILEAFRARGLPIVDQAHGGNPERNMEICVKLMRLVHHIVADSNFAKELLVINAKDLGVTATSLPAMSVIYPSIVSPTTFYQRDKAERLLKRASLGMEAEEFVVFFPSRFFDINGTLSERKRALLALQSYAYFASETPATSKLLAIMPPGFVAKEKEQQAREQVMSLAERLGISGKFRVLDQAISHSMMPDFFNVADCILVPSVEGFGLVYLEAMHCEVPIVGVAAGAGPEFAQRAGLWVPDDNRTPHALAAALSRLASDALLRRHLSQQGKSIALAHKPSAWIRQVEENLLSVRRCK